MTNTNTWYPITPKYPAPLVQVRGVVDVAGRYDAQLVISRGNPPHDRKWASWVKGKPAPLAERVVPVYWQPLHPDKWAAPLPEPVRSCEPQMWSATLRFQAVDDAEVADLARDMERDRDMARGAVAPKAEREALPWWRDATQVKYETTGAVTPKMAEGRVMRAVALCGHGQGLTIKTATFGKILADIAAVAQGEAYATSDYIPRLKALPQDHDDFLNAMAWFVALDPPELRRKKSETWSFAPGQRVLIWRSFDIPLSWSIIADHLGHRHHEYARQRYKETLARVVRVANGLPAYAHIPPAAVHIEALKERNREYKRSA